MTSRHQMKALATMPATPTANTQGPVMPNTPAPSLIERIQMTAPIAMMKAEIEAITGHGLGFTRW